MPSEGASVSPSSKGGMNPQARASHFEEDFVPGEVDEFLVRADKMRGHQFPQRTRTSFKDEALVVPQDYPYREPVEPHPTGAACCTEPKGGLVSTVEPAGRGRRQVPRSPARRASRGRSTGRGGQVDCECNPTVACLGSRAGARRTFAAHLPRDDDSPRPCGATRPRCRQRGRGKTRSRRRGARGLFSQSLARTSIFLGGSRAYPAQEPAASTSASNLSTRS